MQQGMPDNGMGGGMMPPPGMDPNGNAGLTVSNVMKEIQVLKDKFKNDDEDHCKYYYLYCVCIPSLSSW